MHVRIGNRNQCAEMKNDFHVPRRLADCRCIAQIARDDFYLLERIWPLTPVQEEVLRVHVHRLRHKLEPHAISKQYIVTERGAGYRFSDN